MLYRKITSYIEGYLVDNHQTMSAHPIEVKSGKDYTDIVRSIISE